MREATAGMSPPWKRGRERGRVAIGANGRQADVVRRKNPSELDISVSRLFVLDDLINPFPESALVKRAHPRHYSLESIWPLLTRLWLQQPFFAHQPANRSRSCKERLR